MLTTVEPSEAVKDIGTEEFIRELRKLWLKYADPKYIDLLDATSMQPPQQFGFKRSS